MDSITKNNGPKQNLLLHGAFLIYSLCGILSKLAALQDRFSMMFFVYYGLEIFVLFIYAILWQMVLKSFSLSAAFSNKGIVVIWGILWGTLLFQENLTPGKVVAAILIVGGIFLLSKNELPKATGGESHE